MIVIMRMCLMFDRVFFFKLEHHLRTRVVRVIFEPEFFISGNGSYFKFKY